MQRFHYTFFIQYQLLNHRVVTLVPIISGFELKENLKSGDHVTNEELNLIGVANIPVLSM